jgi:hypothetical protein
VRISQDQSTLLRDSRLSSRKLGISAASACSTAEKDEQVSFGAFQYQDIKRVSGPSAAVMVRHFRG